MSTMTATRERPQLDKIDLKQEYRFLYGPSSKMVELVTVPKLGFIMVDGEIGRGETPETSAGFSEAMMALYGLSYTLKFMSKLRADNPIDYTVMPIEGLWWSATDEMAFTPEGPWNWTLMMMQPAHIDQAMFLEALKEVKNKKSSATLDRVRFAPFDEGLCIQIMHIGPYATEPQTIKRMDDFAAANGYRYRGKHHEIYLGDPRRTKPEKLRTVLRRPVERIA